MEYDNSKAPRPLPQDRGRRRTGRQFSLRCDPDWEVAFVPGSADCGVTRNATLEHESLEIDLSDSSTIFEEFLHRMSMIQTDFGRRLGNTAASAGGECPGGSSRV